MTRSSEQMCVACGHDAGYNRAVVDTVADELVGGLCLHCERDSYGTGLGSDAPTDVSTCAFCAHDGFYAHPKWRVADRARSATRGSLTVGYAVEGETLRICDGHFHELARAKEPALADPDAEREPYEQL